MTERDKIGVFRTHDGKVVEKRLDQISPALPPGTFTWPDGKVVTISENGQTEVIFPNKKA